MRITRTRSIIVLSAAVLAGAASLALSRPTSSGLVPAERRSGPAVDAAAVAPLRAMSDGFIAVSEAVSPAVVQINVSGRRAPALPPGMEFQGDPEEMEEFLRRFGPFMSPDGGRGGFHRFGPQAPREMPRFMGQGSGFIINGEEGYILTSAHVVRDAQKITVTLADRRVFDAEVIGADKASDVGLIRAIGASDLPEVALGDDADLRPGEIVVAIGSPFGLRQSVSTGIVSALGRGQVGVADYEYHIQTDAAVNPGNSGGPLVNLNGEVVGINTAIASASGASDGVGFAIPVSMARKIAEQLLEFGEVRRGVIGVVIQPVTADAALSLDAPKAEGALVAEVQRGRPGEKAGLRAGDIILSIDGRQTRDVAQLRNTISLTPAGEKVRLGVWRDGQTLDIPVTVAALDDGPGSPGGSKLQGSAPDATLGDLGLGVQSLTPEIAESLGFEPGLKGALVSQVDPGSLADDAGLSEGMLIARVGRRNIAGAADFLEAIEGLADRGARSALLLVRDGEGQRFATMRLR